MFIGRQKCSRVVPTRRNQRAANTLVSGLCCRAYSAILTSTQTASHSYSSGFVTRPWRQPPGQCPRCYYQSLGGALWKHSRSVKRPGLERKNSNRKRRAGWRGALKKPILATNQPVAILRMSSLKISNHRRFYKRRYPMSEQALHAACPLALAD